MPLDSLTYSFDLLAKKFDTNNPEITRVIFNDPATIVFWKDGSKTVVKCQPGDVYDQEKGLALCIAKKYLGNKSNFNNVFKKYLIDESKIKFLIIKTEYGCRGVEGCIAWRTDKRHICGLRSTDPGYNVEVENGQIWRINHDAEIEYLD